MNFMGSKHTGLMVNALGWQNLHIIVIVQYQLLRSCLRSKAATLAIFYTVIIREVSYSVCCLKT